MWIKSINGSIWGPDWKQNKLLILFAYFFLCLIPVNTALGKETLNLKTYYPSPKGIYRDLSVTGSLSIGTAAYSLKPGQIYAGQSMILGLISSDPDPKISAEGEVIYNSTDKSLKFFDGSEWVDISAGGGPAIISASETCPSGTSPWLYHWTGINNAQFIAAQNNYGVCLYEGCNRISLPAVWAPAKPCIDIKTGLHWCHASSDCQSNSKVCSSGYTEMICQ